MLVAEEAVEIRVLRRQGKSIRKIARMLDVSRNTVRRYLRVEGPPRYTREARPSKLDAFKRYIDERVKAAAPDWIPATVLLRELRALGYPGGYSILKDHLATLDCVLVAPNALDQAAASGGKVIDHLRCAHAQIIKVDQVHVGLHAGREQSPIRQPVKQGRVAGVQLDRELQRQPRAALTIAREISH